MSLKVEPQTMSIASPTATFAGIDSAPSVDHIKDIHAQCISTFESLVTNDEYASRQWLVQFNSLRGWADRLTDGSRSFASRVKQSADLREALRTHLTALHTLLKQANGQEEAETPKSFKIAGIDVLTSPSVQHQDEGARKNTIQYTAISKYIQDLGSFEGSPSQYPAYELRPPTRRSASSAEEGKEGSELSSATSISPLAGPNQPNKRVRRVSVSSANGNQTPVQISPATESLTRQMQAMTGSSSRLSPMSATETTLPPLSQTLQPGAPSSATPRMRSPYDASQYPPPPQPQAQPSHPYNSHGYPPHPPPPPNSQQTTFSQYPQSTAPLPSSYQPPMTTPSEKRPPKRPPSMTAPGSNDQQSTPRAAPQAPHRLLIPNQPGEDPGSAITPSPKLTKTGRVSKALRGEPVHACNICDKVYTRAEHLRRHRSNHRVNLMRSAPPAAPPPGPGSAGPAPSPSSG